MAKRIIDDNTLKNIADWIRTYLMTEDTYTPDDMAQAISDVYELGDTNGFSAGVDVGIEEGIQQGRVEAENEMFSYGYSLSQALTSGDGNLDGLEANINQAKSDITAIKTLIENRGVEVPVGTPSSTYDETIEQIIGEVSENRFMEGVANGWEGGIAEGIEQGKKSAYDEFWDIFQQNGNRKFYQYVFAGRNLWTADLLKPKYDIKPVNAQSMFQEAFESFNFDLREIGVDIDFSNCQQFSSVFQYAYGLLAVGTIDTRKVSTLGYTFNAASSLHTIEKLVLKSDGTQTFVNVFNNCTSLKNIIIEGVIGNNIDFQWSPLTKESIENIVQHLSSDASGKTLTLKKSAVDTAFETAQGLANGSDSPEWVMLIGSKSNQYDGNWTISLI